MILELDAIDAQRALHGFLRIGEMLAFVGARNRILDPFSLLISDGVEIGSGNIFYPNVVLERTGGGLRIGDDNVFFPGTMFSVAEDGRIEVGGANQFGEGGVTVKANRKGVDLRIGSGGRYLNGALIIGNSRLGSGSQIIGSITAQDCELGSGEDFRHPSPADRAGLLKGFGVARGIKVPRGYVLNGDGTFLAEAIETQASYHKT